MSDFEILKYYQQLLVEILEERKKDKWSGATKTRFQRARIETQKLMLKIERKMDFGKEEWR